jgi:hypothetical protein
MKKTGISIVLVLNGNTYEAIRADGTTDDWSINYPTGSKRFFGTKFEVVTEITRIAREDGK